MTEKDRLINALQTLRSGALYLRDGYNMLARLDPESRDYPSFAYQYNDLATAIQIEINKEERNEN
jgi:hypothetical protein